MEFDPDVIVHAAGGVALSRFELEPRLAELDYLATEHTIAAARAVRARYVLVSCDWVTAAIDRPARALPRATLRPRKRLRTLQACLRAGGDARESEWLIMRPADVYGVNLSRPLRQVPGAKQGTRDAGHRVWERGMGDGRLRASGRGMRAVCAECWERSGRH